MGQVLFLLFAGAAASLPPFPVTPVGVVRPLPLAGFGGEYVFQTLGDSYLTAAILAASSRATRFPGGTPADYFNFSVGWLNTPTGSGCGGCDALPPRPAPPAALAAHLAATHEAPVLVLNTLHASLDAELSGLAALSDAGVPIDHLELSNEMYDASRADVVRRFPDGSSYGQTAANWTAALRASYPGARVSWVATSGTWDTRTASWNAQVFDPALQPRPDAASLHLYPGLPTLNLSAPDNFPKLLANLFSHLKDFRSYTESTLPPALPFWVTEWGTWGCSSVEGTWLQGLWHAAFTLLLPTALPRVEVVLPYCSVCGDPAMPSFTTAQWGPVVPPNATTAPGSWLRTPSGQALALVFFAWASAAAGGGEAPSLVAVDFGASNPKLDPAVPSSVALVGTLAMGAPGRPSALIAANLGAEVAPLDVRDLPSFGCAPAGVLCAVSYSAPAGDVARQGLLVEDLLRTAAPVGAGSAQLPPFSLGVMYCSPSPGCFGYP